jgi:hypothetical protein
VDAAKVGGGVRFLYLPLGMRTAPTCKQKRDEECEPKHMEAVSYLSDSFQFTFRSETTMSGRLRYNSGSLAVPRSTLVFLSVQEKIPSVQSNKLRQSRRSPSEMSRVQDVYRSRLSECYLIGDQPIPL